MTLDKPPDVFNLRQAIDIKTATANGINHPTSSPNVMMISYSIHAVAATKLGE